jgi:hypothetical protein
MRVKSPPTPEGGVKKNTRIIKNKGILTLVRTLLIIQTPKRGNFKKYSKEEMLPLRGLGGFTHHHNPQLN